MDGLILVPVAGSHRFLASQMAQGTKVVCVDRPTTGLDVDRVLVDNRRAAQDAVRNLLAGHSAGSAGVKAIVWCVAIAAASYLWSRHLYNRRPAG